MVVYQGPMARTSFDDMALPSSYSSSINSLVTNDGTRKYSGLVNQGATCYLNSVIQTLFMTPEFRSAIYSWKYDEAKDGPKDTCIPLQLQKLFGYLQLSHRRTADTVGLTTSFGWTGRDVFQQQDAQELIRVLFDALEEAFKDTPLKNIIDQLYAGEMIDYVRCIDIDYESERSDKFLDLSFAIIPFGKTKALSSLNECVKMYLRPEILDGDNQYYAEPVSRKVNAIKGIKLRRLPYVMSIQLKRFVFDFSGENVVQKKINDVVKFPMILDMNQYVSKKRRAQSLATEEDNEEMNYNLQDDFEEYLKDQMEILREKSFKKKSNAFNNSETEEDEFEILESLPDLVDSYGIKSNDQMIEDRRKEQIQYFETHGTQSKEELYELVDKHGEWIYELYAVLIHSGAIAGGHYYAYIKDLSSSKWYNFNDSVVTEINEKDVQEAWGKAITTSYATPYNGWYSNGFSSAYGSSSYGSSVYNQKQTTTTFSGSNAYMLMYRKVTRHSYLETSVPGITNDFPSDDMIPDYIKETVKQENEEHTRRLIEEEERRKQVSLSIYWKKELNIVNVKGNETLVSLLDRLWKRFNLLYEKAFEDILVQARKEYFQQREQLNNLSDDSVDSSNDVENELALNAFYDLNIPCPYDRVRLRNIISTTGMKYDSYEVKSSEDKRSIDDFGIANYRQYTVEIRSFNEDWEEYIVGGIILHIHLYQPNTNTFSDSYQLSIRSSSTIMELKQKIASIFNKKKLINYSADQMIIMKAQKSYHMRPPTIEILENNALSLNDGYRVLYQDKLYVDEMPKKSILSDLVKANSNGSEPTITYHDPMDSPGYKALYATLFEMKIFHNIPFKIHPCYDNNACNTSMIVDSRWTISQLREALANVLNQAKQSLPRPTDGMIPLANGSSTVTSVAYEDIIDKSRVRMFLQTTDGKEFRSDSEIRQEGVYDNAKIVVMIGYVPPINHYVLKFNLYIPMNQDGVTRRDQYVYSLSPLITVPQTLSQSSLDSPPSYEDIVGNESNKNSSAESTTPILNHVMEKLNQYQTTNQEYDGSSSENDPWDSSESYPKITKQKFSKQSLSSTAFQSIHSPEIFNDDNEHPNTTINETTTMTASNIKEKPVLPSLTPEDFQTLQPSNFAAVYISNDVDKSELISIPIENIFASEDTLVDNVREELAVKLSGLLSQLMPSTIFDAMNFEIDTSTPDTINQHRIKLDPKRIRLRESSDPSPGRIIRNNSTFRQQNVFMASSRTWLVQILTDLEAENESQLEPMHEHNDYLVTIIKWKRSTWSLTDKIEYILRGELTVNQLCQQLCAIYGISSLQYMYILLLKSYNKVRLSELNQLTVRDIYKSWTNYSNEMRKLKDLSNIDFKLRNGDVLLLQDRNEPLKILTKEDLLSLQYVEEASRNLYDGGYNTYYNSGRYDTITYAKSTVSSSMVTSSTLTTTGVETIDDSAHINQTKKPSNSNNIGIKIKTQKDRQKEALESVTPPPEMSHSDDYQTPTKQSNQSKSTENIDYLTSEDYEFNKQGGITLFSDITDL